jgi:hypothetical protein
MDRKSTFWVSISTVLVAGWLTRDPAQAASTLVRTFHNPGPVASDGFGRVIEPIGDSGGDVLFASPTDPTGAVGSGA